MFFRLKELPELCVEQVKTRHIFLKEDANRGWRNNEKAPTNILIEGENYQALRMLEYTHADKIDVIYIDPPYNTGNNDFVYDDDFSSDKPDEEDEAIINSIKYIDQEDTYRHSKWVSFMEHRLRVARNLLSDRGVIFLSIDDNEMCHLKLLCDAIFGEDNALSTIVWKKKSGGDNDAKFIAGEHEYILVYSKNINECEFKRIVQNVKDDKSYKLEDKWVASRGKYKTRQLDDKSLPWRPNLRFSITCPDGSEVMPGVGETSANIRWRWSHDKVKLGIIQDRIEFKNVKGAWKVYIKQYQFEDGDGNKIERSSPLRSIIDDVMGGQGTRELEEIMGGKIFDYPKPVELIKRLLVVASQKDSIILDFFAGSGTTGQAVQELNREDGGNRQFILCTNNQKSDKLPNGIARDATYPRLQKTISKDTNLMYMKVAMLKHQNTPTTALKVFQLELENRMLPLLKLKYNTFNLVKETNKYIILKDDSNHYLGVYFNHLTSLEPFGAFRFDFEEIMASYSDDFDIEYNLPLTGYATEYFNFIQTTNSSK